MEQERGREKPKGGVENQIWATVKSLFERTKLLSSSAHLFIFTDFFLFRSLFAAFTPVF